MTLNTLSRRFAVSASLYSSGGDFMSWVLVNDADIAIIAEIEAQSDRGAIIIAGSFLERRLEDAIKLRLDPAADKDLLGSVFKFDGPLGTFSAKINVGALLLLYPEPVRLMFHKVRDMRNDAAHETSKISFELPTIRDRCANWQQSIMDVAWSGTDHQMNLVRATGKMRPTKPAPTLYDDGVIRDGVSINAGPHDARGQFLTVIKVLLNILHESSAILRQVQLSLPPSLGTPAPQATPQAPGRHPA
jgi:hypothetical protein